MTNDNRPERRQRSDGERSRRTILHAAAQLATTEGLRGLSIGGLAEHIGMSKSGLYAHFGSKEELQLATIDTAAAIFDAEVTRPALAGDRPITRLTELLERFLVHVGSDTFPGGCFFAAAAAELDTHPGRVRARIADFQTGWNRLVVELITQAQAAGDIDPDEDPQQLAFELSAMLAQANATYVMFTDTHALDRARVAVASRLRRAVPAA